MLVACIHGKNNGTTSYTSHYQLGLEALNENLPEIKVEGGKLLQVKHLRSLYREIYYITVYTSII